MPKKKKTKESTVPELKIDYRYTPKPYFTAPTSQQNGTTGLSSRPAAVRASPNQRSAWQPTRTPATSAASTTGTHPAMSSHLSKTHSSKSASTRPTQSHQLKTTANKPPSDGATAELSSRQKQALKQSFLEMYGDRIEHDVIEMVLQEVNFNENQALDTLSQLSDSESHRHPIRQAAISAGLLGVITPDHSLTPTAPTLSYCSSMTSLDEFGIQQEQTRENLAQVADVLLQSEDINDLDRQRLARSRGPTPRSAYRNGSFLLKNINLGSTESLESNRSHYTNGGFNSHYSTLTTPKKSNTLTAAEKTVSLTDISAADDDLLLGINGGRSASAYTTLVRSDPASEFNNRLIPLEHGDIVIERPANIEHETERTDMQMKGRLNGHGSIHTFSEDMNKLIIRLDDDQAADQTLTDSYTSRSDEMSGSSDSGGIQMQFPEQQPISEAENGASPISVWNGKTKSPSVYNGGILSYGSVIPTPLVSVRPKHQPDMSAYHEHFNKLKTQLGQASGAVMIIIRGLPGSGKSTLARLLCDDTLGVVLSSDDYFINNKGEYVWDKNRLEEAHQYSQNKARKLCQDGISPVIVDNTNTMMWEMLPYAKISIKYNYQIIIAEPHTPWRGKLSELVRRNKHSVPDQSIKHMMDRYEHGITSEQLLNTVSKSMREQLQANKTTSNEQLQAIKSTSRQHQANKNTSREQLQTNKTTSREQLQTNKSTPREQRSPNKSTSREQLQTNKSTPREQRSPNKSTSREQLQTNKSTPRKQLTTNTNLTQTPSSSTSSMVSRSSDTTTTTDDQSETSSVKLSRKKVTGKTIKRNRQTDNVVKLKDKSVEEVMSSSMTDRNSEQTEIMYPSSHITRKPSLKLINQPLTTSEIVINDISTNGTASSATSTNGTSPSATSTNVMAPSATSTNQSAPAEISVNQDAPSTRLIGQKVPIETRANPNTVNGTSASQNTSANHIAGSPTLTKELSATSTNEVAASILSTNQNGGKETTKMLKPAEPQIKVPDADIGDESVITPVNVSTSQSSTDLNSSTLPNKKKTTRKATRSTSLTVLSNVDSDTRMKWQKNEWKIPDYPNPKLPDIVEPQTKPPIITTADQSTLTEPQDYALAYKAMQLKSPLPEGWVMLTAVAKKPFKQTRNQESTTSKILSHDKGVTADMDSDEELNSSDDLKLTDGEKISRLQSCFPQLSVKDISETLELCEGDEQWATNVLLDSNTAPMINPTSSTSVKHSSTNGKLSMTTGKHSVIMTTKQRKRRGNNPSYRIRRAFSFPDTRKMNYLKSKRAVLFNKLEKCIGKTSRAQSKRRAARNEEMTDLIIETNVIEQLDQMFNKTGQPIIELIPESEKLHSVPIPVSICEQVYKYCVDSVISSAQSNLGAVNFTPNISTDPSSSPPVKTVRKNHLMNKQKRLVKGSAPPSIIKSNQVNNYSQDEALARRLQAEEYLPNKHGGVTPNTGDEIRSLNDIMDEQLTEEICIRSLTEPAANSGEPLGAKIKRQQLYEMFSSTAREFIDETFTTCGYNYEQTVDFLKSNYNLDIQNPIIDKTVKSSSVERETDWSDVDETDNYNIIKSSEYSECRSEAAYHRRKRKEAQDMARSAREKKQFHLMQHYTQEAEEQRKKMVNANFAAATAIFQSNNSHRENNEIDFHGLNPQESVIFLNTLIEEKKSKPGGRTRLNLITGWGKNSIGGSSIVKKAVTDFLSQKNIQYIELNRGMLRITI